MHCTFDPINNSAPVNPKRCKNSGNCVVTRATKCTACRYDRCVSVGMLQAPNGRGEAAVAFDDEVAIVGEAFGDDDHPHPQGSQTRANKRGNIQLLKVNCC